MNIYAIELHTSDGEVELLSEFAGERHQARAAARNLNDMDDSGTIKERFLWPVYNNETTRG